MGHLCAHLGRSSAAGLGRLGVSNTTRGCVATASKWRQLPINSEAAAKKKPSKKKNHPDLPLALPGPYQQTLKRSFTVGGLGLHTAQYAYVRVRPAHAGEGRYFVRVPDGTNSGRFQMEEMFEVSRGELGVNDHMLDPDTEAMKVQLFTDYLRAEDDGEFDGTFHQYLEQMRNGAVSEQIEAEIAAAVDEPVQGRSDQEPHVLATLEYAEDGLQYFSRLNSGGCTVQGAEHLLAALEASGVDNARIEIEGGTEIPIIDGSTVGWCMEVERAGLRMANYQDRDKIRKVAFAPKDIITVREGDAFIQLVPGNQQCVTVGIDYHSVAPIVGKQWITWCPSDDETLFRWEFAPARTFAPSVDHLSEMRRAGLVKGGTSDCAVVAHGDRWYDNTFVRFFDDEPVRHAVCDLVGDLSLLGVGGSAGLPLGHVIAYKPDHGLHVRFLRALKQACRDEDLAPVG